ncbi:MAG: transglycosylase SLT domain-containing protein [Elusimicrobiota bacterium]|nr:transglycosylase SLT domain-containing protein [Endomicrobiia bacterium]MDW8166063.1 transglycosylase SLT domain-containing protein [Elusimicrobiota bacterium]
MLLKDVEKKYKSIVEKYVNKYYNQIEKYKIDKESLVYIILSIIHKESSGNPNALGDNGCSVGLMQLNWCAGTPQRFGVKNKNDLFNVEINIETGIKYLFYLINYFNGNLVYAISAYNAGEGKALNLVNLQSYVKDIFDKFNKLSSEKKIYFSYQFS